MEMKTEDDGTLDSQVPPRERIATQAGLVGEAMASLPHFGLLQYAAASDTASRKARPDSPTRQRRR